MTVKNRIRLIRLFEKLERDSELQKYVIIETLEQNKNFSKKFKKPLERHEAVWQTIDICKKVPRNRAAPLILPI